MNMMVHFTAHTINCVCHIISSMFRVLGMYNFALSIHWIGALCNNCLKNVSNDTVTFIYIVKHDTFRQTKHPEYILNSLDIQDNLLCTGQIRLFIVFANHELNE